MVVYLFPVGVGERPEHQEVTADLKKKLGAFVDILRGNVASNPDIFDKVHVKETKTCKCKFGGRYVVEMRLCLDHLSAGRTTAFIDVVPVDKLLAEFSGIKLPGVQDTESDASSFQLIVILESQSADGPLLVAVTTVRRPRVFVIRCGMSVFLKSTPWRDRRCLHCYRQGSEISLMKCTGCMDATYCSQECQKSHWLLSHQKLCKITKMARAAIDKFREDVYVHYRQTFENSAKKAKIDADQTLLPSA